MSWSAHNSPPCFPTISAANRDAWKSVEGTTKEAAQAKYVELLLEVRKISCSPAQLPLTSASPLTQVLRAQESEDGKKYLKELEETN